MKSIGAPAESGLWLWHSHVFVYKSIHYVAMNIVSIQPNAADPADRNKGVICLLIKAHSFVLSIDQMFSKTCEYAIRAVLYVAQRSKGGSKVGIKEIADGIGAPEYFTAKILQDLSRRGLIQSRKGPNGGFCFGNESSNYTLADIVRTIDGDKIFTGCALGLDHCSESKPCPLHNGFKKVRREIQNLLESVRLGTFNQELEQKMLFLKR
jgi:Rrf2 family protein